VLLRDPLNGESGWALKGQFSVLAEQDFQKHPIAIQMPLEDGEQNKLGHDEGTLFFEMDQLPPDGAFLDTIEWNDKTIMQILQHYVNAPYMWGGVTRAGIDCSGLVKVLYRHYGIYLSSFAAIQSKSGEVVDFIQHARFGDLAFFASAEGDIFHVGILLGSDKVIHATESAGRVVVDAIDHEGIVSSRSGKRTHTLRVVKRLIA
jgi:hypothetical protein